MNIGIPQSFPESIPRSSPCATIHVATEGLLPPTGIELTLFLYSTFKVAGLQVHATTPIPRPSPFPFRILKIPNFKLSELDFFQFFARAMKIKPFN